MHWFHLLGSLKHIRIGLIWLVTRGEWGGGWAREAGKGGEMGGGTREQCGSNKAFTGSTFYNWSDLAGDEAGGPGRRARGGRWGQQRGGR